MDVADVEVVQEVMGVKAVVVEEAWVNAVLHQIVLAGLPSAASGGIVRQQTSQMGILMLASVAHPQTVLTGLHHAPSGDTVRRMEVVEVKPLFVSKNLLELACMNSPIGNTVMYSPKSRNFYFKVVIYWFCHYPRLG